MAEAEKCTFLMPTGKQCANDVEIGDRCSSHYDGGSGDAQDKPKDGGGGSNPWPKRLWRSLGLAKAAHFIWETCTQSPEACIGMSIDNPFSEIVRDFERLKGSAEYASSDSLDDELVNIEYELGVALLSLTEKIQKGVEVHGHPLVPGAV